MEHSVIARPISGKHAGMAQEAPALPRMVMCRPKSQEESPTFRVF